MKPDIEIEYVPCGEVHDFLVKTWGVPPDDGTSTDYYPALKATDDRGNFVFAHFCKVEDPPEKIAILREAYTDEHETLIDCLHDVISASRKAYFNEQSAVNAVRLVSSVAITNAFTMEAEG